MGFIHGLVINPIGLKGSLALLWKQDVDLDIINFSQHHIHAKINNQASSKLWFLTMFYGNPNTNRRHESWDLFTKIKEYSKAPQCVLGDFNEITHQEKKYGKILRPDKQMNNFRTTLESSGLFDLGWKGQKYTWTNRYKEETFTKLRLDRAVASIDWIEQIGN